MVNAAGFYASPAGTRAAATAASHVANPSGNATAPVGDKPALKPFADVVMDARAALDAGYERLGKKGDDRTTWPEWKNVVGLKDLDRRTIYAIASNQGGIFSKDEVIAAQFTLSKRQSEAMMAADPTGKDIAPRYRAAISYHDSASPEEKASLEWALGRASAQKAYQDRMRAEGPVPDDVGTANPLVELFIRAMDELEATLLATYDLDTRLWDMPSYKSAMEYWEYAEKSRAAFVMDLVKVLQAECTCNSVTKADDESPS